MKILPALLIFTQIILLSINVGCVTSIKSGSATTKLTLDAVDKILLGKTKSTEIKNLFNAPTIIIPDKSMSHSVWIYCDPAPCTDGRLTLRVDNSTDTIISLQWNLREGDSERTPASIIKRYSRFSFQKKKYIHNYGHYIDRVSVLKSTPDGLALKIDPHNDSFVSTIYFSLPNPVNQTNTPSTNFPIITEEP